MPNVFKPTKKEREARTEVYDRLEDMIELKDTEWPQFNDGESGDRTLIEYVEDNDYLLNHYTPTRDQQDKEEWQANVVDPIIRRKLKAIVANVALRVPTLEYKAVNKNGTFSKMRADIIKHLVRYSRTKNSNPKVDVFFEAWQACGKGTVIKYDGYIKQKMKRKIISSVDLVTGEVEFDEEEVVAKEGLVDMDVQIEEFYIWDFFEFDVQEQEHLGWVKYYTYDELKAEFGQYANFKFFEGGRYALGSYISQTPDSKFFEDIFARIRSQDGEKEYEVYRYYSKAEDRYEIWVNGIPLLRAPLLWGKEQKMYPFSKTIFAPHDDKHFFWGRALPHILTGLNDTRNTMINTMLDKLYRSLKPQMLVGIGNKDLLEIEDEITDQDDKIYLPDVSQVKEMPYSNVDSGDIQMLRIVSQLMDRSSVGENQVGAQGDGVTAREALIANQHAEQIQGVFFMFLEDLWIQKTRIRIQNVLTHLMEPEVEAVVGEDEKEQLKETLTLYHVDDVEFSDGSSGRLGIQVQSSRDELMSVPEIEAREELVEEQEGIPYKIVAITSDYLDDWNIDFHVVSESLYSRSKQVKSRQVLEKMTRIGQFFPEKFMANKDKLFKEFLEIYDESPQQYRDAQQRRPQPQEGEGEGPSQTPGSLLEEGAQLLANRQQ